MTVVKMLGTFGPVTPCHLTWWFVTDSLKNVGNKFPASTASHPERLYSSLTVLWDSQIIYCTPVWALWSSEVTCQLAVESSSDTKNLAGTWSLHISICPRTPQHINFVLYLLAHGICKYSIYWPTVVVSTVLCFFCVKLLWFNEFCVSLCTNVRYFTYKYL